MNTTDPDSNNEELIDTPDTNDEQSEYAGASIDTLLSITNIAEEMDEEALDKIGRDVWEGFEVDLRTKTEWDTQIDEWIKLATQVFETKNTPFPNASNVKYPLLSTAALQFAARAYPSLVPANNDIVQCKVIGKDPDGKKLEKATRIADHMNYQLSIDMDGWEEETDRLLIQLPVVGCLFRKTYFDEIQKKNVSRLLLPKSLVVNYWASSLEDAYRKTEIIEMTKNDLKSFQNGGIYREIDLLAPDINMIQKTGETTQVNKTSIPTKVDATTPYIILEQHTFLDLDEDGYEEPYIITIEARSKKVLRIVARFDSDGIVRKDKKVVQIKPVEYYTKYGFIPNPDGGFYDIGFGHLVGPLNEAANTLLNIQIDSGKLSNLQAGFIGKGLRVKVGDMNFKLGEWKVVNATGDDIRKQIFPLPTKEPSEVLFKLLGLLIESTKELASVAEIFVGKMPGQNTPATTTMASIEQGMKVFTAIYKRVYRSMQKEFEKLFRLNGLFKENTERAAQILTEPISQQDYSLKLYNVCPKADPSAISSTQKLLKAQGLLDIQQTLQTLNPQEITKRMLEAQEQPNPEALLAQTPPPPDPKVQAMEMQMQMDKESHQMEMQKDQMKMVADQKKMMLDQQQMKADVQMKAMEQRMAQMEKALELQHQSRQHQLDLVQQQQKHAVTLQQAKEKAADARKERLARVAESRSNKKT